MFAYPQKASFGGIIHKNKIYVNARPSPRVRSLFVSQVAQIKWAFKLAPATINLPARPTAPEIQVFDIALKSAELDELVLRAIDKAIQYPVFFRLTSGKGIRHVAAYKRPSDADSAKWVVEEYFSINWQAEPTDGELAILPVATDLAGLYAQMLRCYIDLPARDGESLKDHVARVAAIRAKQREVQKLASNLKKEKQFNRKVELNSQLRDLNAAIEALSAQVV